MSEFMDKWELVLASTYELNATKRFSPTEHWPPQALILNEYGRDYTPIQGHSQVNGYELVRRIELAHKHIKTLQQAIDNTKALLNEQFHKLD